MPEFPPRPRYSAVLSSVLLILSAALAVVSFYHAPRPGRAIVSSGSVSVPAGSGVKPEAAGQPVYISAEADSGGKAAGAAALLESWRGPFGFGLYRSSPSVVYAEAAVYDLKRGFGKIRLECPDVKLSAISRAGLTLEGNSAVFSIDGKSCSSAGGLLFVPALEYVSASAPSGGKARPAVLSYRTESFSVRPPVINTLLRAMSIVLFFIGLYAFCGAYKLTRLRRFVLPVGLAVFVLGAASLFSFSLSSGKGVYSELASAFAGGHAYLAREVPRELLQVADPYQYAYAWKYRIWDLSLYKGHFYMYFGPVPALVRLAFLNLPSESFMVAFYGFLWALSFFLCCREVSALFGRGRDSVFALAAGAAGGLSPLLLYLLNIHTVYNEAALAAAALSGFAVFWSLRAMEGGRRLHYALLGLFFGLAFATRPSLAFGFAPFALLAFSYGNDIRGRLRNLGFFLAPFALTGFCALFYNYIRFDSVFEFGVAFQYNATHELVRAGKFFSPSYIIPHLRDYFAVMPSCGLSFPFVRGTGPDGLVFDSSVFSLFAWCPLSVFFAAPLFAADRNLRRFAWAMLASSVINLLVLSSNAVISARYMMDFAFGFVLCGAAALIAGHARKPVVFRFILAGLVLFSVYMASGMALSAIRITDPQRYAGWLRLLGLI